MDSTPTPLFSLGSFVTGTLASLAANAVSGLVSRYARIGLPVPLSVHKRELRITLREMPFIYKDIDSEVICDFVDVDIQSLDLNELRLSSTPTSTVSLERRVRDRRKVLLLGNAGIGKTTYIRHTILSLVNNKKPPFLYSGERVVPFYVPLKAVDNTSPWPIARYLLENNLYLSGDRGRRRLLRLARKKQVMLFLDGYDEVYLDLGSRDQVNFVRVDLNCLVGKVPISVINDEYFQALYRELAECRVWLSSRKEFYASNPLDLERVYNARQFPLNCIGLALLGMTNSRMLLVRNIFNKYRSRAKAFRDLLSEELFLQQIDRSGNDELRDLSQNPLFLTMMCYVYVDRVLETEQPDVQWATSTSNLFFRCIDLLLRDIDAYKARGLPPAQRVALVRRRNAYEDEKRLFLAYFAWVVLRERRNVFDIRYINSKVLDFFGQQHPTQNTKKILETIRHSDTSPDSLGQQLANQGIFVLVEKHGNAVKYDFAHRRFKELLSVQYLNAHATESEVLQIVEREEFSELVYVLMQASRYRDAIFQRLLERALDASRQDYFGRLIAGCADLQIDGYDPSGAVEEFFIRALSGNRYPRITRKFIYFVRGTEALADAAFRGFEAGVSEGARWKIGLAAEVLSRIRPMQLLSQLGKNMYRVIKADTIFVDFLYFIYRLKTEVMHVNLPISDFAAFLATAFAGPVATATHHNPVDLVVEVVESLMVHTRTILLAALHANNPALFSQLLQVRWSSEEIEANVHLVNFAKTKPAVWLNFVTRKENLYVGTTHGVERLGQSANDEFHVQRLGLVFALEGDKSDKGVPTVPATDISRNGLTSIPWDRIRKLEKGIRMENEARGDRRDDFEFYLD